MQKPLILILPAFLIITLIAPPVAAFTPKKYNQTNSIINLLQQLHGNVSILSDNAFEDARHAEVKKNALCNKIDALISQIEAGAYEGALNKLSNDLEKTVKKWVTIPWRNCILDLIKRIIDCIKGLCPPPVDLTPPVIHGVFHYPDAPEYDDYVAVLAYVTDAKSGVSNVTLNYFTNLGENTNLNMSKNDGFYKAEIPPQPYGANVTFLVYAWDNAGNLAVSEPDSYIVGDFHPPIITYIKQEPALPNYNETVSIFINVTEPSLASGIKEAILTYNNGTVWTNITMILQDALYVATIPALPYKTFVQYKVYAFDNAGNWAAMDIYSYTVQDQFLPVARIDAPTYRSYLSGVINVEVYAYDDNFAEANLTVNGAVLASWSEPGFHTYMWNTTKLSDGPYILKLAASDKAGNIGETECLVTVDNTLPTVEIRWPSNGSFVRATVIVEVNAWDSNFHKMELKIGESMQVWETIGSQTYVWETTTFDDDTYVIVLLAYDKAGNEAETSISVTVDNTSPSISNLVWNPSDPAAGEHVNVSVQIFEEGSGIMNVTLWFRVNNGNWEPLDMILQDGNWTCIIPGQEENSNVTFYVECYDKAGNFAATLERTYTVKALGGPVAGFPLSWLLFIIAVSALALGGTVYYFKFKRKRS